MAFLEAEVQRIGLPSLRCFQPFHIEFDHLEVDGIHLNRVYGPIFIQFIANCLLEATAVEDDNDVTVIDSGAVEDLNTSLEGEPESEPEGDSDRLASILKIVRCNSQLLKTVKPLKDSFTALLRRTG